MIKRKGTLDVAARTSLQVQSSANRRNTELHESSNLKTQESDSNQLSVPDFLQTETSHGASSIVGLQSVTASKESNFILL